MLPALTVALALVGAGVAAYLTVAHYDDALLTCGLSDCRAVQASDYAEVAGVPVALLGLGMYVGVLGAVCLRLLRPALTLPLTALTVALLVSGTLFAGYLTYVELFVLEAICQWCVASALITLALLACEAVHASRLLSPAGLPHAGADTG